MRPIITDLMNFDKEIDISKRIEDALVYTHGNTLVITSIQNANRAMSGLQHFKYSHSSKIKNFCGICLDGTIQNEALPEKDELQAGIHPETCILFQDASGKFGVYDNGHLFCCSVFSYPNMSDVVAFAGSISTPNKFAVLHKSALHICKLKLNAYEEIGSYPVAASNIIAFENGYLLQKSDTLVYFENGQFKDYFKSTSTVCPQITDFKVDNGRVVVVSVSGEKCIMSIIGSKPIGLLKWRHGFWDFHDDWIVAHLKGDLLAIISADNPDVRQVVNLGEFGDKTTNIVSGADRYGEKYTITLMKRSGIAFMNVPYAILTGQAAVEGGPENAKVANFRSGGTKVKVPR
ncbi:hypothetical protein TVAG_059120 [Trichomonas vaginalis G3]|uniref:CNH domain-containing protein n=1 Tax=Trichomonas vaginalis (strain ATCC PRA-98 / G3) TaxID=412133 RepID=A2ERI7_TRIV3|nr:hypothetical protein TVAGG3_0284810 [Trichomonas vaginalis G3]EAY04714.1 hypothetical protein TVAG_059120 [Trichomonas vaginalis G3]KAI5526812.1 hypothetical protein TVAGG3_0284810 [Trichomonas vaginalis G3]|eukprot:XP_001316937.1 hypothetical protein [Trichomonas vaginalis G3]